MISLDKYMTELEIIKNQIIERYRPDKIILFGSLARGVITENSDIDICIVKNIENKRELIADMYLNIKASFPFDIVLYTPEEWVNNLKDKSSFAYKIFNEGRLLYG